MNLNELFFSLLTSNSYWSKRGIKGPLHLPFIGIIHKTILTPQTTLDVEWSKKYGKIFGLKTTYYF